MLFQGEKNERQLAILKNPSGSKRIHDPTRKHLKQARL
jgi:hypothetical protein